MSARVLMCIHVRTEELVTLLYEFLEKYTSDIQIKNGLEKKRINAIGEG